MPRRRLWRVSRTNWVSHSVLVLLMDHIYQYPPAMNHTDYYSKKGWYSMLAQAVVGHKYLFRDLCISWPGSVLDTRVLANSCILKKVMSGELLQGEEQVSGKNH